MQTLASLLFVSGLAFFGSVGAMESRADTNDLSATDPWKVDFRFAPPHWQTAICLPDDWQKSLVSKEGALLYDYPGPFGGFGMRISASLAGDSAWVGQQLLSPRVPIVQTTKRAGTISVLEESFAVAPPIDSGQSEARSPMERVGSQASQIGWANPPEGTGPAFRNAAIGWGQPIQYRFKAEKERRYTIVFGFCEGHHDKSGQRVLDLKIENRTVQTIDTVAESGRNRPAVFAFNARDENADGWIDLTVAAAERAVDKNTILNVLWVFPEGQMPKPDQLISGRYTQAPVVQADCGDDPLAGRPPRHDVLLVQYQNQGQSAANIVPVLTIETDKPVHAMDDRKNVRVGSGTELSFTEPFQRLESLAAGARVIFSKSLLPAESRKVLAVGVARGKRTADLPQDTAQAQSLRRRAEQFWDKAELPYDRIKVPDPGIQALLDSSIRNIYQAREIKNSLPAFQVGPTCYRGLWVVDGSFILEAVAYLGRWQEARHGIEYLLSFQKEDGSFMLIDGHWKETGIALWAITRHAQLTGDKAWLRQVWPKVERGFAFIQKMRQMASQNPNAPNAGLIPDGFSDGGLAGRLPEYTNIYWTLAGMKAAVTAAQWLERLQQHKLWQEQYSDFEKAFRHAAQRDLRTDQQGRSFLPIRMIDPDHVPPQKAQWAFLHAVFPGKVFAPDDPLLLGNLALLRSVECQGLVLDTGWLKEGIWNYFASFYAHAWLWLGQGNKAAEILYAFANHASPLLVWREEQKPAGKGPQVVGDMPHNWASAEFIRLVRHALVLERGRQLHLFEGFPAVWARPGALTRLRDVTTEFGPMSLQFLVSDDGQTAQIHCTPPMRTPAERILLHLDNWSGQSGTIELPAHRPSTLGVRPEPMFELKRH